MKTKKQIGLEDDRTFFGTIFVVILILLVIILFLNTLDNEECSQKDIENELCECIVKAEPNIDVYALTLEDEQGNQYTAKIGEEAPIKYCLGEPNPQNWDKSLFEFKKKNQCRLYIEGKENQIKDFDEECVCDEERIYGSYSYFLNDGTGSGRNFNNDVLAISEQEYDEHLEYIDGLAKKGLLKEQYENIEYIKCIKARPKTFQDLNCKELQESYEWILETGHSGICEPFEQGFLCNIKYDEADILKRQLELGCFK